MALKLLVDGIRSSLYELDATCFTHDYAASTSTTVANLLTKGVLGGSVAAYDTAAAYTVKPGNGTLRPVGLFLNDAAGHPYDNNHAVASNKLTILRDNASCEVDVYETKTTAEGTADLVYAVGDLLYCSTNGLLTKQSGIGGAVVIGVVTKVPTPSSPYLGLDMVL